MGPSLQFPAQQLDETLSDSKKKKLHSNQMTEYLNYDNSFIIFSCKVKMIHALPMQDLIKYDFFIFNVKKKIGWKERSRERKRERESYRDTYIICFFTYAE